MTDTGDFSALLAAFAERNGLAGFPAGADGAARLTFDGKIDVEVQPQGDTLFLHTSLGPVPPGDTEAVLLVLLATNAPQPMAEQPVVALDPALGDIVLQIALPAEGTDAERLAAGLKTLLEARERCLDGLQEQGGRPPAGDPALMPGAAFIIRG